MNISILNALWSILVGEKLDLDDPKLAAIITMFDNLFRNTSGQASLMLAILPHPSMAKLPGLRHITGIDLAFKTFKATEEFIEPYITEHKRTLDPENIRDFVDLMLIEIQNTSDKDSSFYGSTGKNLLKQLHNSYCSKPTKEKY
jgi:cytochrome P450 family 2 subfamily U polypeptide 1